jgi:hypothetical protein
MLTCAFPALLKMPVERLLLMQSQTDLLKRGTHNTNLVSWFMARVYDILMEPIHQDNELTNYTAYCFLV